MRFSVVVPVFGTEPYLPRCLDSLVAQTDGDFEAVIVDDASPGGASSDASCAAIAARYGARFRVVRHAENRGAFQARCTGVAVSRGDFIVPLDPDDRLLPETLAKVRAVIDREDPDLVTYWIDCEDGRKTWPHWCRRPAGTTTAREMLREMAARKTMYSIVSKVVRRETYLEAVASLAAPEAYVNTSEDFLATLAILLCCDRVSHLDWAGYRYFSNPTSITGARHTIESFRRACEQTRLAHDAVRAMAGRRGADSETRALLDDIVAVSEGYFCTEAMEGPAEQLRERARVLFETFRPETVGRAFAEGYAALAGSRAYRLGKRLAGLVRPRRGAS